MRRRSRRTTTSAVRFASFGSPLTAFMLLMSVPFHLFHLFHLFAKRALGGMKPRAHRPQLAPDRLRDLLVGQILDEAQQQDFALGMGQAIERPRDLLALLLVKLGLRR